MAFLFRFTLVAIIALVGKVRVGGHAANNEGVQRGTMPESQQKPFPPPSPGDGEAATTRPAADTGAVTDVRKAETDLADLQKKLRADYEATPEYTAAAAAVKAAQADYDTAAAAAQANLKSDPTYAKAVADRQQIEVQLNAARNDSGAQDKLPQLAMDAMNARSAVKKLESDAATADPAAVAARAKLTDAQQKLGTLRAADEAKIKQDADYVAAQQALTDARAKLARH